MFPYLMIFNNILDSHERLGDSVRQRHHVLQGEERHPRRGQRGRLQRVRQTVGRHNPEECSRNSDIGRNSISKGINSKGYESKFKMKLNFHTNFDKFSKILMSPRSPGE